MERDFANDYDEWLRLTGGDTGSGGTIPTAPPQPSAPPSQNWTDPDTAMPDWLHNPDADMSGHTLPPGLRWVFQDGMWQTVQMPRGSQTTTGATSTGDYTPPGGYGGGGGGYEYQPPQRYDLASLNYPEFNAPRFSAPPAFSYDPFSYEEFKAPTLEEAQNEPGFDYALKQGIKAYENSKAFTGTYKGGSTIKGINDYARNMANQNYGQVFERKGQTYDRNRGNAFGNWSANRSNAADNYMMNYGVSRDTFDRNYTAAKDEYAPKARGAELQFGRDWDVFAYEGDDAYRRWKALVDANS